MQKQSLLIKQNRNVNWKMGFLMQIEILSTMNLKNKQRYEYRMEKLKNKCLEAIITQFFRVKHSNLHWYSRKKGLLLLFGGKNRLLFFWNGSKTWKSLKVNSI